MTTQQRPANPATRPQANNSRLVNPNNKPGVVTERKPKNKYGLARHLHRLLHFRAKKNGTTIYRELERAILEYGQRHGMVFSTAGGMADTCEICPEPHPLTIKTVSYELFRHGVWACRKADEQFSANLADFVAQKQREREEKARQVTRDQPRRAS